MCGFIARSVCVSHQSYLLATKHQVGTDKKLIKAVNREIQPLPTRYDRWSDFSGQSRHEADAVKKQIESSIPAMCFVFYYASYGSGWICYVFRHHSLVSKYCIGLHLLQVLKECWRRQPLLCYWWRHPLLSYWWRHPLQQLWFCFRCFLICRFHFLPTARTPCSHLVAVFPTHLLVFQQLPNNSWASQFMNDSPL